MVSKTNYFKKDYRTVGETIMDLVNNKKIQNHVPMKHNDIVRKRISFINEGGGITKNIPKNLLLGSRSDYKNNKLKNFSHIYKRLHENYLQEQWYLVIMLPTSSNSG